MSRLGMLATKWPTRGVANSNYGVQNSRTSAQPPGDEINPENVMAQNDALTDMSVLPSTYSCMGGPADGAHMHRVPRNPKAVHLRRGDARVGRAKHHAAIHAQLHDSPEYLEVPGPAEHQLGWKRPTNTGTRRPMRPGISEPGLSDTFGSFGIQRY
ncbi:hypothetical protein FB451DRAFT_1164358 [Mycena latifolia]|nr:hypothetical protein FB451DRAFT_1164358 [Mycena latifolia]